MELPTYSQIIDSIKTLGLPVVFCLWLMFRTDKRLDKNNELINALLNKIASDENKKDDHV